MPVVVADLHSALPAVVAGVLADRAGRPGRLRDDRRRRAAGLVLPDAGRAARRLLAGTVTVGQAFGGDLEATNVHSGLLAARHVLRRRRRDRHPGAGQPRHRHARGASPASPPARRSTRSPRSAAGRSRRCGSPTPTRGRGTAGVSHHSLTAFGRVALAPADLVVPAGAAGAAGAGRDARRWQPLAPAAPARRRGDRGSRAALRALPVKLSTMGRGLDEDRRTSWPPRRPGGTRRQALQSRADRAGRRLQLARDDRRSGAAARRMADQTIGCHAGSASWTGR